MRLITSQRAGMCTYSRSRKEEEVSSPRGVLSSGPTRRCHRLVVYSGAGGGCHRLVMSVPPAPAVGVPLSAPPAPAVGVPLPAPAVYARCLYLVPPAVYAGCPSLVPPAVHNEAKTPPGSS